MIRKQAMKKVNHQKLQEEDTNGGKESVSGGRGERTAGMRTFLAHVGRTHR